MNRFEAIVEVVRLVPERHRVPVSFFALLVIGTPVIGAVIVALLR